jgi:hypothetical protein
MKHNHHFIIVMLMFFLFMHPGKVLAQDAVESPSSSGPVLEHAVMCESIEAFVPKNPAVVFSLSIGEVLCFSSFDPVPREMSIYHKWYRKDQLSTSRKLMLKPPRWSTFSRIQFREADKGPWRVDVEDENGNVLGSVRFSITD